MTPQPIMETRKNSGSSHGVVYLLRHGVIETQAGGRRFIGWQDTMLNETGHGQARAWAEYFSGKGLEAIYSSDLSRCLETARIIGARCFLEPEAFSALREIRLGQWEGRRFKTIQKLHPQAFQKRGDDIGNYRPPGGESFRDLQERVWPVFETIVRQVSNRILIVTHAGVIRVLLCRILGMPLENLFRIGQAYGALNIVDVMQESCRLQAVNHPPPGK